MARSRRRFSTPRSRKSRPVRADWVYRSNSLAQAPGNPYADSLGTYSPATITQATGINNALSHVLYDSQNYFGDQAVGGVLAAVGSPYRTLPRAARAAGKRATILRTVGIVNIITSDWSLGNVAALGMRIGAFEQAMTGVFSIDPDYSMWVDGPTVPVTMVTEWADFRRTNRWERRILRPFNNSVLSPIWQIPVNWKGRATLDPKDCWGMYTEAESTGVTLRLQFWLRSLVVDEG